MNSHSHTANGRTYQVRSFSLRPEQVAWLQEVAERQRHGNVSRIVQEAIDAYRDEMEARRVRAMRELENVS